MMQSKSTLCALGMIGTVFSLGFAHAGQRVAASPPEACVTCHDVLDKKAAHEPALLDCTNCHVTHDETSNYPSNLLAPTNELCLGCHDAQQLGVKGDRGHIIDNHPLAGRPDPLYPDKQMSCASCHNPHSSNMDHLFRYDYKGKPYEDNYCTVCHWEYANGNGTPPPTPPWNTQSRRY